jgi:glycosyltransferase involved in cell wall biosynthesis
VETGRQVNITVILCTYNRCRDLAKALESIAASNMPTSAQWEVLIVDNNSTDDTKVVAEEFCRRDAARFRYLFENKPGKSNALNAGIREAHGDVIAFTDDDVTVEPNWLRNLAEPLNENQWVGVGGKIVLQWPGSVPGWLATEGSYARHGFPGFAHGEDAKEIPWPPFGPNMAYRKSMFERYGGFRTDLGPSPNREIPRAGEDVEFGRRLISAGKRVRYEPSAVVYHPVRESEINKKHILELRFDFGRGSAREFRGAQKGAVIGVAKATLRWMLTPNSQARFYRKLIVWEKAGALVESRRQKHEAARKREKIDEVLKREGVNTLNLKVGEWVEVRSREEILATLDERGCLGNMPFMPEMLEMCGKRFRVFRRADKTCDNIEPWSIRRVMNAVHLEGARCDGEGHGGCQAGCMIFWKEAWLKRAAKDVVPAENLSRAASPAGKINGLVTVASILETSSRKDQNGEPIYFCQATELLNFTSYMRSWDPRQYVRDLRSGNVDSGLGGKLRSHRWLEMMLGVLRILHSVIVGFFNTVQEKRHWRPTYPFIEGSVAKTPAEYLNLQPGELVEVRSKEEIIATLDKQNRNRGMLFDGAMIIFCGNIYRVLFRVNRMIDEKSGKMMDMKNPCIVLEGVTCAWEYHRLCPKASFPYWRENWLKRAVESPETLAAKNAPKEIAETCEKC